jgi:phosphorylase kinase gamma subunit
LLIIIADLCGTPGYLAPEVLKSSMFADAEGYSNEGDM